MLQILWYEALIKAAFGLPLLLAPLTTLSLAGLDRPASGFWPRLLGSLLLGMALGVWIGIQFPNAHGAIGPAGLVPLNLAAAAALLAPLVMGSAAPTRRGKLLVMLAAIALLALAFIEINHI